MALNRAAFARSARLKSEDKSLLLAKVVGGLDHGGNQVLTRDSTGYRILEQFVRQANEPSLSPSREMLVDPSELPFFDGVVMLDDRRLLRRATLSLAGRLPTNSELEQVADSGLKAIPPLLEEVMHEDAFFERLREGFNDIFLTHGVDGNPGLDGAVVRALREDATVVPEVRPQPHPG